ncbi:hypothetical protein FACS189451_09540 [Bacteroidia bacterium]|nr:hypothetical protein FACS189446_4280 [Bacteroidia bacterium]GHT63236.1 hypothetical protein FACS189451_09540 [Bacteroidia bacterium]
MNKIFTICMLLATLAGCTSGDNFQNKVRKSVASQLNVYPESTLQDLYKNFFQDKFGPGHLISDTAMAKAYLEEELSEFETSANPEIEAIGWENNYVRVNLSLLKTGVVPEQALLDAFIESANTAQMPGIESWKSEWTQILNVIEAMNLNLPGFAQDKASIDSLLTAGKYAVHHSRRFEAAYQPHYRIVSKAVFDEKLKTFIK